MNEEGVSEFSARSDCAAFGELAGRSDGAVKNDFGLVLMPACADLVSDVTYFEMVRLDSRFRDNRANTGNAYQHTVGGKLAQCTVRRHTRIIKLTHELVFRGYAVAPRQYPLRNARE